MRDPRDLFDLTGRVACVTGASSGIGRRVAVTLAAAGAYVIGVARREEALISLKNEIGEGADYVVSDVADRTGLEALIEAVAAPFGPPDIIVHAAGVNTRQTADDVTPEGWDQTLALNLSAPFFMGAHCEFRQFADHPRLSRWNSLRREQGRHRSAYARDGRSMVKRWYHCQRNWAGVLSNGAYRRSL